MAASMNDSMDHDAAYADEWFFASVKLYDELHMYSLQNTTSAMCWTSPDHVCVIGATLTGKSEILDLSLPSRLLASEKGLVKDRDFDVMSGTFHDKLITSVHRVSDRCVITSEEGENLIRTWSLGNETTGIVEPLQTIHHTHPENVAASVAVCGSDGECRCVLFGCTVSSLCLVDLETKKTVYETKDGPTDQMSALTFIDENTFIACSRSSGDLSVGDIREEHSKVKHHKLTKVKDTKSCQWACNVCCVGNGSSGVIARMSDTGHVFISDLNTPTTWTKRSKLGTVMPADLQIQICPNKPDLISTTDTKGNVLLYNTDAWTDSATDDAAEYFRHEGHWVNSETRDTSVRTHLWHPTHRKLVLSAASDGSLHAWTPAVQS